MRRVWVKLGRTVLAGAAALCITAVLGVVSVMVGGYAQPMLASGDEDAGWGAEALAESEPQERGFGLIAPANACGLGASSCFKCHNGQRAEKPSEMAWHTDHAKVNNSCVGCHDGNPRIIRESMAHRGLIANSLEHPDKACASCHSGDDVQKLVDTYLSVKAGGQ